MTRQRDTPDLAAVAAEAQAELLAATAAEAHELATGDPPGALDDPEVGYYEAELRSLRDAADTVAGAPRARG